MLKTLFPTHIWLAHFDDPVLRAALEEITWVMEDEDDAGNEWCDREGYDGYTSYASIENLPDHFPEFADLKSRLDVEAAKFAEALEWDLTGRKLELEALWVNILGEGGSHSGHIHPGSVISGTYYLRIPEGAGALKLEDPRLPLMMATPMTKDDASEAAQRFIYHRPQEGHVLMWESWLRHEVTSNLSEDPRLSISFNYALKDA